MSPLPWLVIIALIAVNALYVAAEFAAVAVERGQLARLARAGQRRADAVLETVEDGAKLDRYIAACQIGITLSSLIAGAYAQATIARSLGPVLQSAFSLDAFSANSAAAVVVLLVLSALQVVFGELLPKSLALQFPERVALAAYVPMRWSMSLFRGFIWLLNGSGFLLLKPFGITPGGHAHVHSAEELALLFAESRRGGTLSPEVHQRLERGLLLSRRLVRQLMVPRSELLAIEASTAPEEVVQRVLQSPYSRIPVYRETLDQVIGTLVVKDVVAQYAALGSIPPIEQLLRPIPFVPGNLSADRLVRFLQEGRSSKAIVVDEFGGVLGIVSIDDVLGQLFGEIGDELKDLDDTVVPRPDGSVRLRGSMPPDAAEPWLGTRWEGSAATLGGHIVQRLGRLPLPGECVEIDGVQLTILEMNRATIRWLLLHPPRKSSPREKAG